jgi:hypothetical protein
VSGIFPLDRNIFSDDEYLSSYVTDRPMPEPNDVYKIVAEVHSDEQPTIASDDAVSERPEPGTSSNNSGPKCNAQAHFSPMEVRPFPKAAARKAVSTKGARRKGETLILTDTPVKERLQNAIKDRIQKVTAKKKASTLAKANTPPESDEEDMPIPLADSDDELSEHGFDNDFAEPPETSNIRKGVYLLVKYTSKRSVSHFVGVADDDIDDDNCVRVKFLTRQPSSTKGGCMFVFPEKEDVDEINIDDIVRIIPEPTTSGGTKRALTRLRFPIDLSKFF